MQHRPFSYDTERTERLARLRAELDDLEAMYALPAPEAIRGRAVEVPERASRKAALLAIGLSAVALAAAVAVWWWRLGL